MARQQGGLPVSPVNCVKTLSSPSTSLALQLPLWEFHTRINVFPACICADPCHGGGGGGGGGSQVLPELGATMAAL